MISSIRMRLMAGGKSPAVEVAVPAHFRCPVSLDVMKDPVTLCTGITYDRQSIESWLEAGNMTCPVTNQLLVSSEMIPNHSIRKMIQAWCVENRSNGVERIPTPKVPVSAMEAEQLVLGLRLGRKEVVRKVERLCKESERNRRCIAAAGAGLALAKAFADCSEQALREELLQMLTMMAPFNGDAKSVLGSAPSVKSLAGFLHSADLGRRRDAVLVVKELVLADRARASSLSKVEGIVAGLVKLLKEPISPEATKATLMSMYYLIISSSDSDTTTAFVDTDLIPLLLELLMDSDRSTSEKTLGVLDAICSFEQGRAKAAGHALTVPILVKKMFRVSDLATEFAISALWKLCKSCQGEAAAAMLVECLQVGAFQKVLLLLQVGCSEKTKEKASELLKLMNVHRAGGECVETVDFKQLKRPF